MNFQFKQLPTKLALHYQGLKERPARNQCELFQRGSSADSPRSSTGTSLSSPVSWSRISAHWAGITLHKTEANLSLTFCWSDSRNIHGIWKPVRRIVEGLGACWQILTLRLLKTGSFATFCSCDQVTLRHELFSSRDAMGEKQSSRIKLQLRPKSSHLRLLTCD